MSDDGVTIINLPSAQRMLREHPKLLLAEFEGITRRALLELAGDAATYPSAPPASEYRRTGTLGRLWSAAVPEYAPQLSGFEGRVGNATPYAPFVQGPRQSRVHAGRWRTIRKIEDDRRPSIIALYAAGVRRVAAKVNQETA